MFNWFSLVFKYKEKKSPDILGKFPESVHVKSFPERRYLWTSRILVICAIFSCCITIMLAMIIYLLLPQRGAIPKFIKEITQESSLDYIPQNEVFIDAEKLLAEKVIERYIILRNEFPTNYTQMMSQWQKGSEFHSLTTEQEFLSFSSKLNFEQLSVFISKKITRTITIDKIIATPNNLWIAYFTATTQAGENSKPVEGYWKAYIRLQTDRSEAGYQDIKPNNPLRIKVAHYSAGYRGSNAPSESTKELAKKNALNEE
ncbi:MAG: hypothetical protein E7019_03390 [Alphaproteobacteria bacterium]|nr:hypothetical protein [Alphaproteobacteria bacterium]